MRLFRTIWLVGLAIFFVLLFWIVQSNNPYSLYTQIRPAYTVSINSKSTMVLSSRYTPHLVDNSFFSFLAFVQSGVRIVTNAFLSEKHFSGSTDAIISQIHTERFDPSKIYIISGGHFSDMYLRNLGIFYNALLDPCLPSSQKDFENREKVALQATAFDLSLLSQSKVEPTTFMPMWRGTFVPVNIYTRPSDSLYGVLYTLDRLQTNRFSSLYSTGVVCHTMQTQDAAKKLLFQYQPTLARLIKQYQQDVMDSDTSLVKKNMRLSSARDGIWRESSFYDNVIAWKTLFLAKELGLYDRQINFDKWKEKIITTFWDGKNGIFLDDLSQYSLSHHSFSADSFIVMQTGFLDMQNEKDKTKLSEMIAYVKKNKLDQPFPLAYSLDDRLERTYPTVRIASPSYMGRSIWSHWGMEYMKALLLVDPSNKKEVQHALQIYAKKIQQTGGYPELYDTDGNIFHSLFYKSVLHTGWVINYEEVKAIAGQ